MSGAGDWTSEATLAAARQCGDVFGDFAHVCQLDDGHPEPHRCEDACGWRWFS